MDVGSIVPIIVPVAVNVVVNCEIFEGHQQLVNNNSFNTPHTFTVVVVFVLILENELVLNLLFNADKC